jgi:hypothetical protein
METIENGTVLTQITTRRSHEQPRFAPGMKPEIDARSPRKIKEHVEGSDTFWKSKQSWSPAIQAQPDRLFQSQCSIRVF